MGVKSVPQIFIEFHYTQFEEFLSANLVIKMVKIFVGRLPEDVSKEQLEEMFKEFGEVMDCCVLKGYAFVHMTETDDAKNAIA